MRAKEEKEKRGKDKEEKIKDKRVRENKLKCKNSYALMCINVFFLALIFYFVEY